MRRLLDAEADEHRRVIELDVLYQKARSLAGSGTPEERMDEAVAKMVTAVGADAAAFGVPYEGGVRPIGHSGPGGRSGPASGPGRRRDGLLSQGFGQQALTENRTIVAHDRPSGDSCSAVTELGGGPIAALPVGSPHLARGVLVVSSSREDYFDQSLVRLLSRVASSMGVLIDNARLFAMEQSNSALLGALFRIASALTGPQPFADKAQAALDEISNLAGDAHVTLMVLDTNEQVLRSLVSAKQGRPTAPITSTVRLDASVVGECYFKGLPVIANTHAARDDAHDQVIAAGVEPVLALPVRLDGQLAAVLVATSTEPDHFSANAQSTLESVAEALGSLLENARNRNAWTRRW